MPLDVKGELNRLAGTFGFEEAGAANIWATTTDKMYDTVGALNMKGGNVYDHWIDMQGAANQLAGTFGLGTALALSMIAGPPPPGPPPIEGGGNIPSDEAFGTAVVANV